jgi:hypothetical protein
MNSSLNIEFYGPMILKNCRVVLRNIELEITGRFLYIAPKSNNSE